MATLKHRVSVGALVAILSLLLTPSTSLAGLQTLNNQPGNAQSFQNDTNVIISSANSKHVLGWQGLLSLSRGGTGANSFLAGSLIFSDGTKLIQDNAHLFWDITNKALGIGTKPLFNKVAIGDSDTDSGYSNKGVSLMYNNFNNEDIWGYTAGQSTNTLNNTQSVEMFWKSSWEPTQTGGYIDTANYADPIYIDASKVIINALTPSLGVDAKVGIGTSEPSAVLDVAGDIKGQSTIILGSPTTPACIEAADSDGSGVSYITVNDGVLSVSLVKPDFCN